MLKVEDRRRMVKKRKSPLITVVFLLLCNVISICCATSANDDTTTNVDADADILSTNLISWLRDNGAYINEKLIIKYNGKFRGVYATQDMEEGERLCSIPNHLIIQPTDELMEGEEHTYCGTIKAVMKAIGDDDGDANTDNMTPYARILAAQPQGYLPAFYSKSGTELLDDMLWTSYLGNPRREKMTIPEDEEDELPPHGLTDLLDELKECNNEHLIDDPRYMRASMLVMARADYDFMIPFYDLFNHDNGKYNIKHEHDHYAANADHKKELAQKQHQHGFVTTRPIKAGEELFNSYNHCNVCHERFDWYGTPEMWLEYGFVENIPQRWLFDFARVKFDLEWKDGDEASGEVVVNFLVPFSEKGQRLLQEELTRLDLFAAKHRNTRSHSDDMTNYEWESLWEYYDALHRAIKVAVQSNAPRNDFVWKMGHDWWVKDGTAKENGDEHYVVRTKTHIPGHDDL